MHPVSLIFGAACIGAYILAYRSKSGAAELMALLLAVVWAAANHLAITGGMFLLPLTDLPFAMSAFVLWFERRQRWQAWLVVLFGARMPLHVLNAWGGVDWVVYLHMINALFLASLVAIAWTGGIDDFVAGIRFRVVLWLRCDVAKCPRVGG